MSPKEYDAIMKARAESQPMDRRKFARTTAGLFVAASVVDACGDGGGPGQGTLTVDVVGLTGPVPPNGGTVLVTTTASGSFSFPTTLPLDGDESASVPAGDYTIVYTPPTGYLLNGADSNTKNVTVPAGGEGTATFNVVVAPTTGTIRVNVTGLAVGAISGGSAAILRTDIGGQVALNVPITPATGTANSALAPGTYQVTYTVPGGYALNGGVTNPVTGIVLATSGLQIVAFAVSATSSGADIYSHGFEDSASGQFSNGAGQAFLNGSTAWSLETGISFRGTKAVKQTYVVSGGNVGDAFFHDLVSPRASVFIRFAYRQSNPFNTNGVQSNADVVKVCRVYRPTLTGPFGGIYIPSSNEYNIGIDNLVPNPGGPSGGQQFSPNVNVGTQPRPNARLGQWTVFELFVDYTVDGAVVIRCWIEDVLYFDRTLDVSNKQSGANILAGRIQFDGTVNSMASANSTAWFDDIGFCTSKLGIPA